MKRLFIAQTQHHCQNQHSVVVAHPAAVIAVEDIRALMQTVLNAKHPGSNATGLSHPVARFNTGNERHQFIFTAFGLAHRSMPGPLDRHTLGNSEPFDPYRV